MHRHFSSAALCVAQTYLTALGYLFAHPDVLTRLPPCEGMRLLCLQDTEASGAITVTPGTCGQGLPALTGHQEDRDIALKMCSAPLATTIQPLFLLPETLELIWPLLLEPGTFQTDWGCCQEESRDDDGREASD